MPPPAALAPPAVSTRSLTVNRARLSRRRPTTMGTSGAPLPSRALFAHLAGHTVVYSVLVSASCRLLYTKSRSYKKLAKTELDPSGHYNISLLMPRRQATSNEQRAKKLPLSGGDHVQQYHRIELERIHERLHGLKQGALSGGELLPQRVAHPPRGGPEEAWHAVPGSGRRGRVERRGRGQRERRTCPHPRSRGSAPGP